MPWSDQLNLHHGIFMWKSNMKILRKVFQNGMKKSITKWKQISSCGCEIIHLHVIIHMKILWNKFDQQRVKNENIVFHRRSNMVFYGMFFQYIIKFNFMTFENLWLGNAFSWLLYIYIYLALVNIKSWLCPWPNTQGCHCNPPVNMEVLSNSFFSGDNPVYIGSSDTVINNFQQ